MNDDLKTDLYASVFKSNVARGHVFIVDDDDSMRESMRRVLVSQGYRVYVYGDPLIFLEMVTPVAPAVILLDMRMPGMTGDEVQLKLNELGIRIPVVFISGESTVQQAVSALQNGAKHFLVKPVGRQDLLDTVDKAVQSHTSELRLNEQKTAYENRILRLTPREREVLELMLAAFGNQEISQQLGISYATAKQYKSNILTKLDAQSMSDLFEMMGRGR